MGSSTTQTFSVGRNIRQLIPADTWQFSNLFLLRFGEEDAFGGDVKVEADSQVKAGHWWEDSLLRGGIALQTETLNGILRSKNQELWVGCK